MRMWSQEEKRKNRRRQVSTLTLDRLLQEEERTEGQHVIQTMTWDIRGTHFCPARVAGWFPPGTLGATLLFKEVTLHYGRRNSKIVKM